MSWQKKLIVIAAILISISVLLMAVASSMTGFSVRALTSGNIAAAARYAGVARPIVSGASVLTRQRSPTLICWQSGLEVIERIPTALERIQTSSTSYAQTGRIELGPVLELLGVTSQKLTVVSGCLDDSIVLRHLISPERRAQFQSGIDRTQTLIRVLERLFGTAQTWVAMFQNVTELRPTGGFTGSYGLFELRNRSLQLLGIEDIYDADGQVRRFRDAPVGIREYTSGNNGLRLPDANWWPDFPTSAQTQLDFLADAGKKNLTGLAAVNLTLLQNILTVTGPIALPDYNTTLTVENAPTLLRSHADDFFPGSTEKKQLLLYVFQQLQYQFTTLTDAQKKEMLLILLEGVENKDIQVFSVDPQQQLDLQRLGVTGEFSDLELPTIGLVEANVGINKANHYIERALTVSQEDDELALTLVLKNTAPTGSSAPPASESGYVNYQRIVTTPELKLDMITTSAGKKPVLNRNTWLTRSGNTLEETGFLTTVLPGESQSIRFTLQRPDRTTPLQLWHQPGIGAVPLTYVDQLGATRSVLFAADTVINP